MTMVDVLDPNNFERTGQVADIHEAWEKGYWVGTFNLWIVQSLDSGEYVLYQRRAADARWAPNCLDVAVGGYYEAGEVLFDGLREAKEEIGRRYDPKDVRFIGRKLYVSDHDGRRIRNVVDVCIIRDDTNIESFTLQESELSGFYRCGIDDLVDLHEKRIESFTVEGIVVKDGRQSGHVIENVDLSYFPYNWDNYHRKMAHLCQRFFQGCEPLLY